MTRFASFTKKEVVFKDILCAGYQSAIAIKGHSNFVFTDCEMDILVNEVACLNEKYFAHLETLNNNG